MTLTKYDTMESTQNTIEKDLKILIVEDQYIEALSLELILKKVGYTVCGMARSVQQAIACIEKQVPDLVCIDIFLNGEQTGIDLALQLREKNIAFIYISANSGKSVLDEAKKTHPYGFIVKPFREEDVVTTLEIAFYRHTNSIELQLLQESILQKKIEAISYSAVKWEQAFVQFGKMLQMYIPFDYMEAYPQSDHYNSLGLLNKNYENYEVINPEKIAHINSIAFERLDFLAKNSIHCTQPERLSGSLLTAVCQKSPILQMTVQTFGIRSCIAFPLQLEEDVFFQFYFYSRNESAFTSDQVSLLKNLETIIAKFVITAYFENAQNKSPTAVKKVQAPALEGFESMVGCSQNMVAVFNYIKKVAPSETSVLILGESGTGKEKVAHSIHKLSERKDKPFVTINCGAIPSNLAESLLFGHEKGSFTGASERTIGKFELADGGTIFLDEIGEMPIDLQVKLLRVLQEKEIERIGGRIPIKIDVRIIAATNLNLEEEVASGRFRLDLYYRLLVFPIEVPPLRERRGDIKALALHFINLYCGISNRNCIQFSENAMQQMTNYDWPGNIRQLEHIVQRSILLADEDVVDSIQLPHSGKSNFIPIEIDGAKTIHEIERDYISYILQRCKGKVSGSGGAAEMLNIPASTLTSKIKKLGIKVSDLQMLG